MASGRPDRVDAPTVSTWLRRVLGDPSLHGLLIAIGLLLALWPFVRSPEVGLAPAAAYLFAVWAAFVAALAGISRAREPRDRSGSSDRA
jgi:hypothetical protein